MDHLDRAPDRRTGSRGAALIEYLLLLALFTLVAVPGVAKLKEGTGNQARNTSAKLGGTPVGTTPPPTTRPPVTTTTKPPSFMVVDAGPDCACITPGVAHTQEGTITSPANPVQSLAWQLQGHHAGRASGQTTGPETGSPESRGTSYTFTTNRPGRYYLKLSGTNLSETKSDFAEITVSTGHITVHQYGDQWWSDYAAGTWSTWTSVWLTNQYGEAVTGVTVSYKLTANDGEVRFASCTITAPAESCGSSAGPWSAAASWIDFEVTGITGECVDSYDLPPTTYRVGRPAPPAPTTTAAPTTSTSTTSTTTTTAAPTTTTPATTTTRRGGPNG